MRAWTVSKYKKISYLIEIIFGLILLINGVILLINHFGYLPEKLSSLLDIDAIFNRSAQDWRSLIEFIHTMTTLHIGALVMICMGITIIAAGIHTKRSL